MTLAPFQIFVGLSNGVRSARHTIFRSSMVRSVASFPMQFSIGSATTVHFDGERYLHAYLATQFDEDTGVSHLHFRFFDGAQLMR